MWTVLLIAFAFTGGKVESTSQECDAMLVACHDMYPETRLTAVDKAPDEAELETLCPLFDLLSKAKNLLLYERTFVTTGFDQKKVRTHNRSKEMASPDTGEY
ncbi:hypothetical protein HNY73_015911 [Argiope bruennichi]|uniref:Uncharacterized protein n=1 Tax=Argiope bruennichi TaxID=94029 RepID=A0A8T0EL44_ARGBR|nr:hypothetical protein HNY73_015911 [Argiope bruennichi]